MEQRAGHGASLLRQWALPAIAVGLLIAVLIGVKGAAEASVAGLVGLLPFGFAFAAGVVASVNPCGFILLPSYVSYHLGTEEAGYQNSPLPVRMGRAVALGVVATGGFVLVFAGAGTVIAAGGQWLAEAFPLLGVLTGLGMVAAGVWLLATGRSLVFAAATRASVSPGRNLGNVFLFGVAYAVGSLGCTLPVFLGLLLTAVNSRNLGQAAAQFISYSLGMGAVLVAVTLGAALSGGAVARALRRLTPHVHRFSAFFLVGAGLYLLYYWGVYARSV